MKGSWQEDPAFFNDLFDLLDRIFPGVRGGAEDIRRYGVSWESVSTPFVLYRGGRVVSHVGVIGLPLILGGRPARVGSVHAVATDPDHRRKGYYRALMEEAIEDSAGRFDTLILTTENPEYYEPFGFRRIGEHRFVTVRRSRGREGALRVLDLGDAADIALLHRLLETREPVSRILGVVNEKTVFLFNEGHRSLHYAEDLDAVLCVEREGTRLRLYDVVAPELPGLDAILESIPGPVEETVFFFTPDRLTREARAEPRLFQYGGPSYLMARGPFAAEGIPFALPRSVRT
ncbi:MAG: GNAT family N-acetyltransferase [Candidatus Eisenbacteria bacterium]|nr:GNAT family N-acetyltransferase [Candidatus Eisenbacteria bacterium]